MEIFYQFIMRVSSFTSVTNEVNQFTFISSLTNNKTV